jgi:hypothetical protein
MCHQHVVLVNGHVTTQVKSRNTAYPLWSIVPRKLSLSSPPPPPPAPRAPQPSLNLSLSLSLSPSLCHLKRKRAKHESMSQRRNSAMIILPPRGSDGR